jgi:salicylate hydroxylase
MDQQHIAIIGAGVGGLAAAALLAEDGHHVTVFERFAAAQPVGAGLLLQPIGLSVLACLGIDDRILASGSRIDQLYGRAAGKQRTTLDVRYSDFAPQLFGVGIHRSTLFDALLARMQATSATLYTAAEIITAPDNGMLTDAAGQTYGPFDLIVDASGARSALRAPVVRRDRVYPFGALWGTVRLQDTPFRADTLDQRYKRADHMVGVLPVGLFNGTAGHAAFFWSLKLSTYDAWRQAPLADWKATVLGIWPETEPLLAQFQRHEDLTCASYRDVVLRQPTHGRVVFLGDAAHCTSPQLGQGANLALVDALVLAQCVKAGATLSAALVAYTAARRRHVRFYQWASRWLTPFFQSDSLLFAKLRFFTCDLMCQIPLAQRVAAQVLSGTKTGIFSRLNPGVWHPDYDVCKRLFNANADS